MRYLADKLRCPNCNSPRVAYEGNDNTEKIKFSCSMCNWEIETSYNQCEAYGLLNPRDRSPKPVEIILLNEEGEVVKRSMI